jgi:hypothetical protein
LDHICPEYNKDSVYGGSATKIGIAFVYCEYDRQGQQTALELIKSITQQLVERDLAPEGNSSLCHATKFIQAHQKVPPTLKDYILLLRLITKRFDKTIVLVDALDECAIHINNLPNRVDFVEALRSLPNLKLFITSRDLPAIREFLLGATELQICSDPNDIMSYVNWRIKVSARLTAFIKKQPLLREEIVSTVEKKYSNMYVTVGYLDRVYVPDFVELICMTIVLVSF